MLYTNWLHIGAVSVLNSIGDFFGFSAGLKTDYSVFGFARLLWEYGGEFGDESAKIKVAAVVLMIAVGIAVICALAAVVYVFEGRIEVRDALRHSSGLIAILALALWIGSIYINDQLSQDLHYSCSGIECTGWLYFSAIVALFLLVKGVSIIVPETIEYADFEDSEERSDHFETPEPVNPEDYIPKERTTLRQYFSQDGEKKENNAEI